MEKIQPKSKSKATAKSKTMWAGLLTLILGFVGTKNPQMADLIRTHASEIIATLGVMIMILRRLTGKPIAWLPIITAFCILSLPSCVGTTRSPLTGINYIDGRPQIDKQAQETLLIRLSQLVSGVKPKEIIKEALPTVNPTK